MMRDFFWKWVYFLVPFKIKIKGFEQWGLKRDVFGHFLSIKEDEWFGEKPRNFEFLRKMMTIFEDVIFILCAKINNVWKIIYLFTYKW